MRRYLMCLKGSLLTLSTLTLALAASGCSLIVDSGKDQCATDTDCKQFGSAQCVSGVCIAVDAAIAPPDMSTPDLSVPDMVIVPDLIIPTDFTGVTLDLTPVDLSMPDYAQPPDFMAPPGPPGCYAGVLGPNSTNDQIMNACSYAQNLPFDNCGRLGLCGPVDGGLPVSPPADLGPSPQVVNPIPTPTVNCRDIAPSTPLFATGSSNHPPLVAALAPLLAKANPPYTLVWETTNSCTGVSTVFSTDPTKQVIKNVPASGSTAANYAYITNPDGSKAYCLLDPTGTPVDVGQSDVYSTTCASTSTPGSGIGEYNGPIQAIVFAVNANSSENGISAEAAHMLYGNGGSMGTIPPWTDPTYYMARASSTGTNQLVSRAIGISPTAWWGLDRRTAANLATVLIAVPQSNQSEAIGVLSNDVADQQRGEIRSLFFQSSRQLTGYVPDSTVNNFDKQNVRDGHYTIWGPVHYYTSLTAGVPNNPGASALFNLITAPKPSKPLLNAIIDAGYVPPCAMKVQRTSEMGPLSVYTPPFGCGCYFETYTNSGEVPAHCKTCVTSQDCPTSTPACNNGFCEIK